MSVQQTSAPTHPTTLLSLCSSSQIWPLRCLVTTSAVHTRYYCIPPPFSWWVLASFHIQSPCSWRRSPKGCESTCCGTSHSESELVRLMWRFPAMHDWGWNPQLFRIHSSHPPWDLDCRFVQKHFYGSENRSHLRCSLCNPHERSYIIYSMVRPWGLCSRVRCCLPEEKNTRK